jgi:hypothetical protein
MMGEAPSVAFAKVTDPAGNVLFVSEGEAGAENAESDGARADSAQPGQGEPRIFAFGKDQWEAVKPIYTGQRPARLCLGGDGSSLGL